MKRGFISLCAALSIATALAGDFTPSSNGEKVEHKHYSLSYIEAWEQAEWVYYSIAPEHLGGGEERSSSFRMDPLVSSRSAVTSDYTSSGYDRGHLCPAADMSFSPEAMRESFYMSNVSPQLPAFNRGGWKSLESCVRGRAEAGERLHVVVGPIFECGVTPKRIGKSKVAVPQSFYKIIYSTEGQTMVGYIMPNAKIERPLGSYVQSVDSIESVTNIDFFPQLEDSLEAQLEAVKGNHIN